MKRSRNSGFTLVEIMIVVAIIALLAAIAIPNVLRGRTSANEAAAIGNQRALMSSLEMFRSVNNNYPASQAAWQGAMYPAAPTPAFGPPSFNNTMAGDATAATGLVQGYMYTYGPGGASPNTYTVLAVPQALNQTGTRSFFINETGTVRHCIGTGAVANAATWNTIDVAPVACT